MSEGGFSSRLLNPEATAAVVIGAHDWSEAGLGRARSFLRSAKGVVRYLIDSTGLGIDPILVLDLFDDLASAGEQLGRIRDTLDMLLRDRRDEGRPVADLLVYYVGHGHTDDQNHLSLLVRRSRRGMEAETGIKTPDLARVLKVAAPQQRRLIVLDCCFSEVAVRDFIGQSSALDQAVAATAMKDLKDDQPRRGTLLLCSSPVGEVSMGAPNAKRTLFTGSVLEVLQHGVLGPESALSFADLRDATYNRMVENFGANAPMPILHQTNAAYGDLTRSPAFLNKRRARRLRLSQLVYDDLLARFGSEDATIEVILPLDWSLDPKESYTAFASKYRHGFRPNVVFSVESEHYASEPVVLFAERTGTSLSSVLNNYIVLEEQVINTINPMFRREHTFLNDYGTKLRQIQYYIKHGSRFYNLTFTDSDECHKDIVAIADAAVSGVRLIEPI